MKYLLIYFLIFCNTIGAQKLFLGSNILFPVDHHLKGLELGLAWEHNEKVVFRLNSGYARLTEGYKSKYNYQGKFVGLSISRKMLYQMHPNFSFLIGGQMIFNHQDEVYKLVYGKTENNILTIEQKGLGYNATGFHFGWGLSISKRLYAELIYGVNFIWKRPDPEKTVLNSYIFGIGTQYNENPLYVSDMRSRLQLNIHLMLWQRSDL